MQQVARETWVAFERRLERAQVSASQRPDYHRWSRFYLDFCHKYGHPPRSPTSLDPFLSKLTAKNQSAEQRERNAAKELIWQWFFPAPTLTFIPTLWEQRRYHLHESHVQGAVKQAATRAGIPKRVSPHTFRHTHASHLLLADYDLQTIQKLLGHSDIKTTMIYLQTVPSLTLKEAKSPLDLDPTLNPRRGQSSV